MAPVQVLADSGASVGHDAPNELVDLAMEAERLGYDSVWTGESLTAPRYEPLAVLA